MRVNVSVDPGVVTLGFAVWDGKTWGEKRGGRCPIPIHAEALNVSFGRSRGDSKTGQLGSEHAALKVAGHLKKRLAKYDHIDQLICEKMEFRSTHTGIAAVDDVLMVAFACGCIAQVAADLKANFHAAPVSIWKGNLTKQQVVRRIINNRWGGSEPPDFLSDPDKPSHDWDAVGIGLWAMGFFE